jgi:hypothetical protein
MTTEFLLRHSLLFGAAISALMTAFILGTLRYNAELWLDDYPPDVRAKYGPMPPRVKRLRNWLSVPLFAALAALLIWQAVGLAAAGGGQAGFGQVALSLFISLMTFNLVDWLLIDWLILGLLRPRFAILPGTEGMAGYNDYGIAFRGFVKGTVGIALASLLLAGLAVAIMAL